MVCAEMATAGLSQNGMSQNGYGESYCFIFVHIIVIVFHVCAAVDEFKSDQTP